jgi:hypothetical protein|tara:strand:- start:561 stop:884 length:324 start_codon:yes stop_codon:yes gene_type:complete
MKIVLYTELDCPDCIEVKKGLNENNITFENKDLNEVSDNLANRNPNKWEHIDLIRDYNLPPWVPTAVITEGDKMTFVCSSNKTGNKGDVYIAEEPEIMVNQIKEIIK